MPRLMSVAHTVDQVLDRSKTVTRRQGWWRDKNGRLLLHQGDRLTLCRKVMGRKPGEPLERLAEVRVWDISREPLYVIRDGEAAREGFPDWSWDEFVAFYCATFGGTRDQIVTRIEFRYLDLEPSK